jgi:predicted amidohydrolase YtcJ
MEPTSMFGKLKALSVLGVGVYLAGATYAAAQQADPNSPDEVLINGRIVTMDASSSIAEAIAVRGGKVLAVCSNASIKALIRAQTRVFDVAGKTFVSGLIDTHAHFKAAGMADYVVNMSRAKTVAEAIDAIKRTL